MKTDPGLPWDLSTGKIGSVRKISVLKGIIYKEGYVLKGKVLQQQCAKCLGTKKGKMVKTQYLIKKNVFKMIFRALWWALKEEACSTLGEIRYNNYTTFFHNKSSIPYKGKY